MKINKTKHKGQAYSFPTKSYNGNIFPPPVAITDKTLSEMTMNRFGVFLLLMIFIFVLSQATNRARLKTYRQRPKVPQGGIDRVPVSSAGGQHRPASPASGSMSSFLTSDKEATEKEEDGSMIPTSMNLMRNLFHNYAKEVMPQRPVVIAMNVFLYKIKATIEKEGIFECVIDLVIEWRDRRMTWNPTDYGNITLLALNGDQVWLPDIGMLNSADHPYAITRDSRFVVRTNYKGEMRVVPSGTARTWCRLLLWSFPFDVQTCSLEFESWSLDTSTMTFDGKSRLLIDTHFDSNQFYFCSYEATTYFHTYEYYNETFTRIRFDMTVKRKSTFQVVNLLFPCAVLSFIQLLVFFLPSVNTTADRISFATTGMLTLVVFQTFFAEELPRTSETVTALSKYTTALILISAFGIIESVVAERFHDSKRNPPPLKLIRILKRIPPLLPEKSEPSVLISYVKEHDEQAFDVKWPIKNDYDEHVIGKPSVGCDPETLGDATSGPASPGDNSNTKPAVRLSKWTKLSSKLTPNLHNEKAAKLPSQNNSNNNPELDNFPNRVRRAALINPTPNKLKLLTGAWMKKRNQNAILWREVAFRIDFICFIICLSLVILIPGLLFLPVITQQPSCGNLEDQSHPR